jgi:hypothetical protein
LGTVLIVSDPPAPADATYLTYGVSIRRAALDEAIARYRSGDGPRVLIGALRSRDAAYYIVPHSSELARQYVVDGGVLAQDVEVLPSVSSELEEAQRLRDALAGRGWRRVVVYVLDLRARRSAGTLKRAAAPTGVELRVVAVRDVEVRLERWWESREGLNAVYNEYPRLAYYWLRGAGWPESAQPTTAHSTRARATRRGTP